MFFAVFLATLDACECLVLEARFEVECMLTSSGLIQLVFVPLMKSETPLMS